MKPFLQAQSVRTSLALLLTTSAVAGCGAHFYKVETQLEYEEQDEPQPEITAAPNREGTTSDVQRVAILWPSRCVNESAASSEGDAVPGSEIVSLECGVEMAALERAFAKHGFSVISWDAVRHYAQVNEVTPEKAAQKLGAPVLVRVNSLQRAATYPGGDGQWERTYKLTDERGRVLRTATVPDVYADQLDSMATDIEGELAKTGRLAVTLNVSVENIPTGEIAWFYRWTNWPSRDQQDTKKHFYAKCGDNRCTRVQMKKRTPAEDRRARSGSTREVSVANESGSERRRLYTTLVRETVADMVRRFSEGEGFSDAPARKEPDPDPEPRTETEAQPAPVRRPTRRTPDREVTVRNERRASVEVTLECPQHTTTVEVEPGSDKTVSIEAETCTVGCEGQGDPDCPAELGGEESSLEVR